MTELLGRIAKLLDLGKLATLTGPGILMAIALLLLLRPVRPADIVISRTQSNSNEIPAECRQFRPLNLDSRKEAEKKFVQSALEARNRALEGCLAALAREVRNVDAEIAAIVPKIVPEDKLAQTFLDQYEKYLKENNDLAGEARDKYQAFKGRADGYRRRSEEKKLRKSELQTEIELRTADLKDVGEKQKQPNRLRNLSFGDFASQLSDSLVYISLLGLLAGLLLDPINKSIFQFLYTQLESALTRSMPTGEKAIDVFGLEIIKIDDHALQPNFAIGKKLISHEDLEAIINGRYRQAEVSFGLLIPVVTLILAYLRYAFEWEVSELASAALKIVGGLILVNAALLTWMSVWNDCGRKWWRSIQ